MANTRKLSLFNIVGIMALYCCMSEFTILTPSIASFAAHFANTAFTTILFANSITGIVSVPVSIIAGALVNKIGFRPMAIIGILLMSLGGAFPFLMPGLTDYSLVIFSRIVVGIGLGILFPLGGALIIAFFSGIKRSRYLGMGIMLQFIFAIIYTIVAGFLTKIAWNYSFLSYLVALIPLVAVIIWLPEAKSITAEVVSEKSSSKIAVKEKIPGAIYGYAFFGLVAWTALVTVQVIASSILDMRGLGDAGMASIVISACGVGIIISGIIYPYVLKLFKNRVFAASGLLVAIGMLPCFFANSAFMYGLGVFVIGLGGATFFTAAQNSTGNLSPKSRIPFINGLMTSMMNLGPFFAPYLVTGSALAMPQFAISASFLVCSGFMVICTIVGFTLPLKAITQSAQPADECVNERVAPEGSY